MHFTKKECPVVCSKIIKMFDNYKEKIGYPQEKKELVDEKIL